ncbi:hypothetical protein AVEN_196244-1 [Araneus ventricosus]|uniref:Uncharacterized protein n=1 Tax=Araneus ventricosus TaxID=182803 RepID=A0A4Y2JS66_ARAVE|nr:hypothetical protein AVEN_196244-1 [Araneus ventricosus]
MCQQKNSHHALLPHKPMCPAEKIAITYVTLQIMCQQKNSHHPLLPHKPCVSRNSHRLLPHKPCVSRKIPSRAYCLTNHVSAENSHHALLLTPMCQQKNSHHAVIASHDHVSAE